MVRKNISLVPPFRYIGKSDARQDFDNPLRAVNHIGLDKLIRKNRNDEYVVVFDYNTKVAAFILFRDIGTHFYIVLVETNTLIDTGLNPGSQLIDYVEQISKLSNYKKVMLDSTENMINRYEKQWGYHKTRYTENNSTYGKLTRMEKDLI